MPEFIPQLLQLRGARSLVHLVDEIAEPVTVQPIILSLQVFYHRSPHPLIPVPFTEKQISALLDAERKAGFLRELVEKFME
jgi:hypothetical protein